MYLTSRGTVPSGSKKYGGVVDFLMSEIRQLFALTSTSWPGACIETRDNRREHSDKMRSTCKMCEAKT